MAIEVINTGTFVDGKEIKKYVVSSGEMELSLLSYGAVIQSVVYKGNDTVLGYDTVEGYINNSSYQGSMVGRYVGRIMHGKYTYNGTEYHLSLNSGGKHHSHGGFSGFNRKAWDSEIDGDAVIFSYTSPDGEEGYPGNITVTVRYSIVNGNEFTIEYTGLSDKDTPFNPTNHVYFNLNNDKSKDCLDTLLQIDTDYICDTDEDQVSNGEYLAVEGTPVDFRVAKPNGRDTNAKHDLIRIGHGHDHTYLLGEDRSWKKAAEAYCEESGIKMQCYTDMPIVTLYAANWLDEKDGKFGVNNFYRQGFCLETSFVPNSVNIPHFPNTVIKAGEKFYSKTVYIFSK